MARTKSVVLTTAEKNVILGNLKAELKVAKQSVKTAIAAEAAHNKAVAKGVKQYETAAKQRAKEDQKILTGLQKNTAIADKIAASIEQKLIALMPAPIPKAE